MPEEITSSETKTEWEEYPGATPAQTSIPPSRPRRTRHGDRNRTSRTQDSLSLYSCGMPEQSEEDDTSMAVSLVMSHSPSVVTTASGSSSPPQFQCLVFTASTGGVSDDMEQTQVLPPLRDSSRGEKFASRFSYHTVSSPPQDIPPSGERSSNASEKDAYRDIAGTSTEGQAGNNTIRPGAMSVRDGHAHRLSKAELTAPVMRTSTLEKFDMILEEESDKVSHDHGRRKKRIITGVSFLIFLVAVITGITSRKGRNHFRHISSLNETENLIHSERWKAFEEILLRREISTNQSEFYNPSSSQFMALAWLSEHDLEYSMATEEDDVITRYVLAVFFYRLNGPHWSNQSSPSWLDETQHVCEWRSIECNGDDDVVGFREHEIIGMQGRLPLELNALPYFTSILIAQNDILGLEGPLTNLRELSLPMNRLSESDLPLEEEGGNEASGNRPFPLAIFDMPLLETLDLRDATLTGPLPDMKNLVNLVHVDFSYNWFDGSLSTQFVHCTKLKSLAIMENFLSGDINHVLGNLPTTLVSLEAPDNRFLGSVTTDFSNYVNLEWLDLASNRLTGPIPDSIFQAPSLTFLDLSLNTLTGQLPEAVGSAGDGKLVTLSFYNNSLTGSIPTSTGNLLDLKELTLQDNMFDGPIPSELGNCQKLSYLALHINQLTGTIPTELGNLQEVEFLSLNNNKLDGTIPTELSELQSLRKLRLNFNMLTSVLPSTICEIPSLVFLSTDLDCGDCVVCGVEDPI